ncbi:MAG: hypothetical protein LBM98_11615 [Oscillospiraceae bacterium]|jgi:hypothetical protein|nr:hypothetical protein [Oscillospiraceae bacterium]
MARKIAAVIFAAAVITALAVYLRTLEPAAGADSAVETVSAGYSALISEEAGFLGVVTVTDGSGTALYKWQSSEGYVLAADVSPSHNALAVLTAGTEAGFRLRVFSLGNETEQGSYNAPERGAFYDIKYLENNRIALIGNSAVTITDGFAREVAGITFNAGALKGYAFNPGLTLTFSEKTVNYINGEFIDEPIA